MACLTTVTAACGGKPTENSERECLSVETGTGVTAPVPAPSDGGLRVTEQGFTTRPAERPDDFTPTVSIGAMIENTSTLVAYQTKARFIVTDANGAPAVNVPEDRETTLHSPLILSYTIPIIMPGQSVGIGRTLYPREKKGPDDTAVVAPAHLDIDLVPGEWWPQHNDRHPFGTATIRVDRMEHPGNKSTGTINFGKKSAFCYTSDDEGPALVYRDAEGTLIGGENFGFGGRCKSFGGDEIKTDFVPAGTDFSKTELYAHCSPEPKPDDPPPSSSTSTITPTAENSPSSSP